MKSTIVKSVKSAPIKTKKRDFIYAVGKRKTAAARVRIYPKKPTDQIIINQKPLNQYFPYFEQQQIVTAPLKAVGLFGKFEITVKVAGGGAKSQAEAVRHGIARALLNYDEKLRKTLRGSGYLTRDSRKKERKKPGLKRARRAPQWQKR